MIRILVQLLKSIAPSEMTAAAKRLYAKRKTIAEYKMTMSSYANEGQYPSNIYALEEEESGLRFGEMLAERQFAEWVYEAALDCNEIDSTVEALIIEAKLRFSIASAEDVEAVKAAILTSINGCALIRSKYLSESEKMLSSRIVLNTERAEEGVKEAVINVQEEISKVSQLVNEKEQWANYQKRLAELVVPSFGTPFSCNDLYVPLNALRAGVDKEQVLSFDDHMNQWIEGPESFRGCGSITFLMGNPGSGKSVVLKMLARRLAIKGDVNAVLVKMKYFSLGKTFHSSVLDYINSTPDSSYSLTAFPSGKPLVIILDGLDEVASKGESTWKLADRTIKAMVEYVERCRAETGSRVKIVATMRTSLMQVLDVKAGKTAGGAGVEFLELLPYYVNDSYEVRHDYILRQHCEDPKNLLEEDKRIIWWEQYESLTDQTPETMRNQIFRWDNRAMITIHPIVNHLVAVFANKIDFTDTPNKAIIYESLLRGIIERRGEGACYDRAVHKSGDLQTFEGSMPFFEAAAVCAWRNPLHWEISDLDELARQCKKRKVGEKPDEIKKRHLRNFLIAGYIRPVSVGLGDVDQGGSEAYEFVHVSFAEYLVARVVANLLYENYGSSYAQCKAILYEELACSSLSDNTLEFLSAKIDMDSVVPSGEMKRWIIQCFNEAVCEAPTSGTDRQFQVQFQKNLLALHSCLSMQGNAEKTNHGGGIRESISVSHMDTEAFIPWLASMMDGAQTGTDRTVLTFLNGVDFGEMLHLPWSILKGSDLSYSRFSNSNLGRAKLSGANLSCAALNGADLYEADLEGANLRGAMIERAGLQLSVFREADLSHASLSFSDMWRADFRKALLVGANLFRADFRAADMRGVCMRDANCTEADFRFADLNGADFTGANLSGAIFDGSKGFDQG